MKLIVLGNNGSFPGRDGACPGYLIQNEDTNILIDCGSGVISRMQRYCKIESLDAIVLSHLHSDHISDMYVLRYGVDTKRRLKTMDRPIDLYAPSTPVDVLKSLEYNNAYKISAISDNMELYIKSFKFRFFKMNHPVETYGMRIEKDGKVLSYTADTIFNDNIINLARDADLFLCESTATESIRSASSIPHLSAKQAAEIARYGGAKKLLLTHFWYEENKNSYLREASSIFKNVLLSEEFMVYEI